MEMLKALKNQWKEKLGGKVESVEHGGLRPVHTRQLTPFPVKTSRPARRFLKGEALPTGATCLEAPITIMVHRNPLAAATATEATLTETDAAAATATEAALTETDAALTSWLHTNPTPLTATSIDGDDGFRSFHVHVAIPPPFFAGPTENDRHSPTDEFLLRLNGAIHHRSSVGSPPPTSVQPAEIRAPSLPWNRVEIQQQAAPAPLAAPLSRSQMPTANFPATAGAPANPQPELFFGNIPLNPHLAYKIDEDKIASAFNNLSRKPLNFIPPSMQNGEVIVRPSIDMIRAGSKRWNTAVGYFLGKKPYFHHLNEFEVIEGGPWLYLGQPIVLQKWEPGMVLRKLKHTEVPVWIKLRHLPVELWTTEGLSIVASGIGRPLYPNAITRACTRLDFTRVCVMLNVSSKLPKHVVIMMPNELGGHSTATCPKSNKIEKPKVAVYVQKRPVQPPPTVSKPMAKDAVRTVQHTVPEEEGTVDMEIGTDVRSYIDKGKAPLTKCDMMNAAFWNVRGLNRRDHQVAVKELVNEFRLNFLGLLETRVSAVNVLRVQSFLPQWSWFTDYDMPGNRIWIAWDDELLDVDVLNLDVQFIHCRINIRCAHLSVLATVVYGANDSVSRRGLWQSLVTLADSISDEPWIVGGDFNTVVDMSEVCGASADIHLAMNEFRDYRLLVNDAWLRLWLNSHYQCLNARTSNHSPLVLRGETDKHTKEERDLFVNVKLAAEFLAMVQQLLQIDRHNSLLLCLEKCCKLVFFKATKLEQEESQALVQSVTREEIKDAFFDIAEDKEPGPDGYSSGFYKAAWLVIGEEMIKAILEFFTTGRLLKQVNTTILALIPKTGAANEMCLKVDLRKAYDTVEWDFLSAVLQLFGFPGTFIGWVEECVTTPMFSVCINGNPHGFFKGSRGLRQGDPMSPFLFVLIMEVLQLMLLQLIDQNEGFSSIGGARSLDYSNFALQMTSSSSVKLMWNRFGYLDTGWTSSPNCPGYMPIHKRVSLFSPVQHRMSGNYYLQHYISRRVTFPSGNGFHITERGHQRGGKKDAYLLVERKLSSGISKGGVECGVKTD
ncbi:hypothetical protein Sango_2771200 [Sesamum angolense]|uniref:Reverse transcriptase domain-containing protein n=1 Tax=Sesamum angolense TaxID=2727404 RepID=A0AAE1T8K5_9LAMI|nr:hypothetical protein Sango_2771200 [Sesamum angolense]